MRFLNDKIDWLINFASSPARTQTQTRAFLERRSQPFGSLVLQEPFLSPAHSKGSLVLKM